MTTCDVSVIITLYPPHFQYITNLIKNIELFTLLPKEVIISISEYNHNFPKINSTLNIKLLPVQYKQNAAQNRNRAIQCASGDYICIIDGDDFVHIRKLEILNKVILENPKINLLLHNYEMFRGSWDIKKPLDYHNIDIHKCYINPTCTNLMTKPERPIHHGHVFFKRNIFNTIKYPENIWPGEDGYFCQTILKNLGEVYMIDLKLIGYRK
jgi:glycosyltransferase involved in cell wall biosynthesis